MEIQNFIDMFAAQLEDPNTKIDAETDFVQSDFWDSLTAMVIKVMIEDEFGIDIPMEKLNSFNSIKSLFIYLKENKG